MSMWFDRSVFFTTPISSNLPKSLLLSRSSVVKSSCTLTESLCQFQDLTRLHHSAQFLATPSMQITPEQIIRFPVDKLLTKLAWFAWQTEARETELGRQVEDVLPLDLAVDMVRVDPVPGELLLPPVRCGGLLPLLLSVQVEVVVVLCPGYHRQQTRLLAVQLSRHVRPEVRVYPGLAAPGELVTPDVHLERTVSLSVRCEV